LVRVSEGSSYQESTVLKMLKVGQQRGTVYTEKGTEILVSGTSQKADHPSATFVLYSVYMQNVVLVPSARIFLVLASF